MRSSVREEEDGGGKDDAQVSGLSNRVDWMVVSFTERATIDFLVEKWRDQAFSLASISFGTLVRLPGEDIQQRVGWWVCKSKELEEAVG